MRRMIAAGPPVKRPPQAGFRSGFFSRSALFATVALALLVLFTAAAAAEENIKVGEFIPATPPQPAPETGFSDIDGKRVTLADFAGKPVLVNLWATWCRPCLKEMPSLDRLQQALDGKLVIVAVAEDRGGGQKVQEFVAKMGLKKLVVYLDPKSDLGHAFGVRGLPTTIVIDKKGRVVGRVEGGAEWDGDEMMAVLKPLIEEDKPPLKDAAR